MWYLYVFLFIILTVLALLVFIIITEGRYFGERFLRWLYDRRTGAFEVRNDWELWENLIHRLQITSSEQLLDLGTQTGHLPRLVARQRGFHGLVIGIDWSEEMIQEAKRQSRLEGTARRTQFICSDVRDPLPFPDNTFTLVVSVTGLLNGLRAPEALLKEITRVLIPDGRFAINYNPRQVKLRNSSTSVFLQRLNTLGFSNPQIIPWTPTRSIIVVQLRNPNDK